MRRVQKAERRQGLTLKQWTVLFAAFVIGAVGSVALREALPPASVQAGVIHSAPLDKNHHEHERAFPQ